MGGFQCVSIIAIVIIVAVSLGFVGGGSYMCYAAQNFRTCADWSNDSKYSFHKCDYVYRDAGAMLYCREQQKLTNSTTQCVCYDPITRQPECISSLPTTGISTSLLIGGIVMIIGGILVASVAVCVGIKMSSINF